MTLDKAVNTNPIKLPTNVRKKITEIAQQEGFKNESNITTASGSNLGDGFLGVVYRITITGKRNENSNDSLSLIAKIPPSNEKRREFFGSYESFDREILAYQFYLPEIVNFIQERALNNAIPFSSYPKCYGTVSAQKSTDDYGLILQDLKQTEYKMWNKIEMISIDHANLVVIELGKLHGLSLSIKDQNKDLYEKIQQLNDVMLEKLIGAKNFVDQNIDRAIDTLDLISDRIEIEKMKMLKENFRIYVQECVYPDDEEQRFMVLNHGDCWTNNMMFLYNENNIPQKVSLFDWQLMRCGLPVLDLMFFLFTSTHKPLRDQHYQSLLNLYYETLSNTIRSVGSDPEKLFSFIDFQRHLIKYGKYGLLMAPNMLQVITADRDDVMDLDIESENFEGFVKKSGDTFNTRMRDVIKDAVAFGYL